VKLHAAIDMGWRAIISFHFTRTYVHEVTQLEPLLAPLWDLGNVYADSGYLSMENCRLITAKGGVPFIRPKRNTHGHRRFDNPFSEMMERFQKDRTGWMRQYHQRSVIEAVFSGLKRRLGGCVSSVKRGVQQVEIALKIIVYNLMMLARKCIMEEYF
jgi:transposase